MTAGEAALRLFDKGLCLVATPHGQKIPRIRWKLYQKERPTREQVIEWSRKPQNYSVVTGVVSRVVVVDLDSTEAEAWADIHLEDTPWRVRTRRGHHRYYRHPGSRVLNVVGLKTDLGPIEIDIKGDGGLAMGPYSVHPSGFVYLPEGDWLAPVEELPVFDLGIIPPRRTLVAHRAVIRSSQRVERARRYLEAVPGAIEGEGGDRATYVLACRLVRDFSLDENTAAALLAEWNSKCSPRWTERQLQDKCRNAVRYGTGPVGGLL